MTDDNAPHAAPANLDLAQLALVAHDGAVRGYRLGQASDDDVLCRCGHPSSDHNNADSCGRFMECGCRELVEEGE